MFVCQVDENESEYVTESTCCSKHHHGPCKVD